jgi:hypothetical protein
MYINSWRLDRRCRQEREGGEDKNIQLMIKFNVHFFFSSSYSLTRRKGITYGINTKKKKRKVLMTIEK